MTVCVGNARDNDEQSMDLLGMAPRQKAKLVPKKQSREPQHFLEKDNFSVDVAEGGLGGSSVPVQTEFVYTSLEIHKAVHLHGDWNSWKPIALHIENGNFINPPISLFLFEVPP